jgi:hypothetical protein
MAVHVRGVDSAALGLWLAVGCDEADLSRLGIAALLG